LLKGVQSFNCRASQLGGLLFAEMSSKKTSSASTVILQNSVQANVSSKVPFGTVISGFAETITLDKSSVCADFATYASFIDVAFVTWQTSSNMSLQSNSSVCCNTAGYELKFMPENSASQSLRCVKWCRFPHRELTYSGSCQRRRFFQSEFGEVLKIHQRKD